MPWDAWQRQQQLHQLRRLPAVKQSLHEAVQDRRGKSFPLSSQLEPLELAGGEAGSGEQHPGRIRLLYPCGKAQVQVTLPPGLALSATRSGQLDLRLQLLEVQADWPVAAAAGSGPRVLHPSSGLLSAAVCTTATLALHGLHPQHASRLLGLLAIPLAVADTAAAAARLLPSRAKGRQQGLGSEHQQQPQQQQRRHGAMAVARVSLEGLLLMLRNVSGPAATLATGAYLWELLQPSSYNFVQCLVALAAVAADYNALGRQAAQGRIPQGPALEAAWRARHKAAAQRLAPFMGDLPDTPPLAPALDVLGRLTIAAGVAVEGCGLVGAVGRGGGGAASLCGSSGAGRQLLLAASYRTDTKPVVPPDSNTQLQRSQLLELFTTPLPPKSSRSSRKSAASRRRKQQQERSSSKNSTKCRLPAVSEHKDVTVATQVAPGRQYVAAAPEGAEGCEHIVPLPSAHTSQVAGVLPTDRSRATSSSSRRPAQPQLSVQVVAGADSISSSSSESSRTGSTALVQQQAQDSIASSSSSSSNDPLAFLSQLPLFGQADHAEGPGVKLTWAEWSGLGWRAVYLALVFTPFCLVGLPMLLVAAGLLRRAAGMQELQQRQLALMQAGSGADVVTAKLDKREQRRAAAAAARSPPDPVAAEWEGQEGDGDATNSKTVPRWWAATAAAARQVMAVVGAILDLLLLLMVGGHWQRGVSAWESGALFLRRRAWKLLLWGCGLAGAAFIKWGQWAAARRDLFPQDFCDTLAALHDRAPRHSFRRSKVVIERAFDRRLEELFDHFEREPIASGSIAQIHRATLKFPPGAATGHRVPPRHQQVVAVKVRHPNVHLHIQQDFKLLRMVSQVAAGVPALRGLSLRETVSQFSHTMTAQADLRVEAVHALRFCNNFTGVSSNVGVPRPVPGLVSREVLVETFEPGASIAYHIACPSPLNTQVVALGVDTFLKMLLTDNFVHTDLHPGNILVRQKPGSYKQAQQQQQQGGVRVGSSSSSTSSSAVAGSPSKLGRKDRQWWRGWFHARREAPAAHDSSNGVSVSSGHTGGQIAHQQQALGAVHGSSGTGSSSARPVASAPVAAAAQRLQQEGRSSSSATATSPFAVQAALPLLVQQPSGTLPSGPRGREEEMDPELARERSAKVLAELLPHQASDFLQANSSAAQIVLLDFGLAEQLTPPVRKHFISFLNHISSGNGARAARHLLQWSGDQGCPDRAAFVAAMREAFDIHCDIHSEDGINLDGVLKQVLGLARRYQVNIDSSYASLVIAVAVITGFATALDPEVNLMDAATPTLLAYSLTGRVFGRLYQ